MSGVGAHPLEAACARTLPALCPGARSAFVREADLPRSLGWLGAGERARLGALTVEKRRRDWLAGRWAARIAARRLLAGVAGPGSVTACECLPDPDGAPGVWLNGARCAEIGVSIAHSGGVAGAVAWPGSGGRRLGLDLERFDPVDRALYAVAFRNAEARHVRSAATRAEETERALSLWTAKEAALKALRLGLRVDLRDVSVYPGSLGSPWLVMLGGERLRVRHAAVPGHLAAIAVSA